MPLQDLEVGAQCRERCAQLVSGIPHQTGLLRPCGLQLTEQLVERHAELGNLVGPIDLDPAAERLARCDLGDFVFKHTDRFDGTACHEVSETGSHKNAECAADDEKQCEPGQRRIGLSKRSSDLDDPCGLCLCEGSDPDVDAVDPFRAEIDLADREGLGFRSRQDQLARGKVDGSAKRRDLEVGGVERSAGFAGKQGGNACERITDPRGARTVLGDVEARDLGVDLDPFGEALVDLSENLAPGSEEGSDRCHDHGDRHGGRRDEGDPAGDGHASERRTYPTPRTVWIRRDRPPSSVLRRR